MYNLPVWLMICALCLTLAGSEQTRNVTSPDVNPGCPDDHLCKDPWVVHVVAEGETDTFHHLWGTHGAPAFITAVTNKTANFTIDWEGLMNFTEESVTFEDLTQVHYAFGFVIPNLILFNDVNDTGKIDNIPEIDRIYVPMTNFTWRIKDMFNTSDHEDGVVFETDKFNDEALPNDTSISIQIMAYGQAGRSSVLPHLIRTLDSAEFDIILDNLILNLTETAASNDDDIVAGISGFSKPRWALDFIMFSMEHKDDVVKKEGFQYATHKSLDDENTPGIFNLDEITTLLSRETEQGGYMQWRPVCYLTSDRDVTHSTIPNMNTSFSALEELDDPTRKSLAFAMFGDNLVEVLVSTQTIISFGEKGDKFYTENNFTTWTLAYGVGSPPPETFSTLIIVVISLGIGIPSLVFLVGGSVISYRKCQRN